MTWITSGQYWKPDWQDYARQFSSFQYIGYNWINILSLAIHRYYVAQIYSNVTSNLENQP